MNFKMFKELEPKSIRTILIQFAIAITYITSYAMGIITAKYQPSIMLYTDFLFTPISLMLLLFIYLLYMTKSELKEALIDKKTKDIVRLYGKGLSFENIKTELKLPHVNEVKRAIVKFCNIRGVET